MNCQFGKFSKSDGRGAIEAFRQYTEDIRNGQFPKEEHAYKMVEGELPKLKDLLDESE